MPRYPWKTAPCVPLQNPLQQNCRRSRWSGVHCFLSWDKSIHELQDPPSAGPHQRPHCKRWTTEPAGTLSQHTSSPHLCDWDTCQCAVARGKGQGLFGCKWSVATCNPPAASGPGTHKMHSSQCLARNGERAPLKMSWELPAKQLLQWHPKNHWPPAWGSSTSRWPRPISRLQCSPGRSAWNWSRWWRRRWRGSSQRLSAKALPPWKPTALARYRWGPAVCHIHIAVAQKRHTKGPQRSWCTASCWCQTATWRRSPRWSRRRRATRPKRCHPATLGPPWWAPQRHSHPRRPSRSPYHDQRSGEHIPQKSLREGQELDHVRPAEIRIQLNINEICICDSIRLYKIV